MEESVKNIPRQIQPISLSTVNKRKIPPSNKPPTSPRAVRGRKYIKCSHEPTSPVLPQQVQGAPLRVLSVFKTTSGVKTTKVRETVLSKPTITKNRKEDSGLISSGSESHIIKPEKIQNIVNEPLQVPHNSNKMPSIVKQQHPNSRTRLAQPPQQHTYSDGSTQTNNNLTESTAPSYPTTDYIEMTKNFKKLQESHTRLETEYSSLREAFTELSVFFTQNQRYIIEKSAECDRKGLNSEIQRLKDQLKQSIVEQSKIEKYQQDIAYLETNLKQCKKDQSKTLENYSEMKRENGELKELNGQIKVKPMQRRDTGAKFLESTVNSQAQDINQLKERNEELEEENRQLKRRLCSGLINIV